MKTISIKDVNMRIFKRDYVRMFVEHCKEGKRSSCCVYFDYQGKPQWFPVLFVDDDTLKDLLVPDSDCRAVLDYIIEKELKPKAMKKYFNQRSYHR